MTPEIKKEKIKTVLSIIKDAHYIKQHPEQYYIYCGNLSALVNCDQKGNVTSFIAELDGTKIDLTGDIQKQFQAALDLRLQQLKINKRDFSRTR
jgi:hypothetical protein